MKLAICIMHAAFEPSRRATLERLLERLGPLYDDVLHIEVDKDRIGAWRVAKRCWDWGMGQDVDWVIVLNDDAIPCEDFVTRARHALGQRDKRDPVCFYTAHPHAKDVATGWYTTFDDLVGVGCALSCEAAAEFLNWADDYAAGLADFSDDGRINLWAMATGRKIYTTVPSLVDHQLPNETTVTWSEPHSRTAVVPPEPAEPLFARPATVTHLGRTRKGNHWELLHRVDPTAELIERAYAVERNGEPVSETPHVFIAVPAYQAAESAHRASIARTIRVLDDAGIQATHVETPGDSLVTRGRHCLVHEFLRSNATHLLQWDADIECLDDDAVRAMVHSGHDIVGGAYPWRDGSGRVVVNPLDTTRARSHVDIDPHNCIEVAEVGTGFLLTSRKCIVALMARHPELMYQADLVNYMGVPMWALFDVALEMRPGGRRRYASEDWRFCSLAREAGYKVHVYYPPVFRHWGKTAHEGHIIKAWGMQSRAAAQGADRAAE